MKRGSSLRPSHASFELSVLLLPRVTDLHAILLLNTITKSHSPFTLGTPFILFNLLPNLGIQTISSIAHLILLPII